MDGYVIIGTEMDTKSFDAQVDYVESQLLEIEHKLKQADMGFEVGDTQKLEAQYEKLVNQLGKLKQKQADLNKTDFSSLEKNIDKIGNSVSKTITKVGKWALAIFGIRTAYNAVRGAVSTLSQYNEQLATDIQYIQFALASVLQPVIDGLIQLAYKLLTYVNYIAQAWFGVNLFANASTKSFEKNNKALGNSVKSAKELNKQIAGFDEMNVLNDTSSNSGGGAGADAISLPSIDLSSIQGEIPEWIKWIADNGNLIKDIIIGIGIAIASLKLAQLLKTLGLFSNLSLWQLTGGLALIIGGIALAIKGVIDFIKDPSWENFLTILQGIALIVAGIAVLMGAWIVALVALGVAIVAYVIQNWDKVKEILGKVGSWIYDNIIKPVGDFFGGLWNGIKNGAIAFWEGVKSVFSTIGSWIYTKIIKPVADFFVGLWDGIVSGVTKAVDKVKSIFNTIKTFFSNIITTIINLFKTIGTKVGDAISGAFKAVVNGVLSAIENILNNPIKAINGLIKIINKVPGIDLGTLPTFKLPRLAVGGIVNMPGRGVPIGGAITGEAGAEGVIPLTDSQAMETLGQAIGRYITINASITNTMNGRIISRELQKINNNSDFARNS